jgi:hypothetical protein
MTKSKVHYLNSNEALVTHANRLVEVESRDGRFLRGAGTTKDETTKSTKY